MEKGDVPSQYDLPRLKNLGDGYVAWDINDEISYGVIYACLRYILVSGEIPSYAGIEPEDEHLATIRKYVTLFFELGLFNPWDWLIKARKELVPAWWYVEDSLEHYVDKEERKTVIKMLKADIDRLFPTYFTEIPQFGKPPKF